MRGEGRQAAVESPFSCWMRQSALSFARGRSLTMRYPFGKLQGETMSAKFDRRHFIAAGAAATAMPFLLRRAWSQAAWPSRQIRMICSYPAGGQTDLLARAFGDFISRQVGKIV